MDNLPSHPDEAAAGRKIDIFRVLGSLVELFDKYRQIDVPRVQGGIIEHLEHQSD